MTELAASYLPNCQQRLSDFIADHAILPIPGIEKAPRLAPFSEPSNYSLLIGGKRIRPVLVYAAAHTLGRDNDEALDHAALAVELIHTYSLIHDDLPAMDNDDLRRGQPTLHKVYDDATAILAGDGLQARAFELLADAPDLSDSQRVAMIKKLAAASGPAGMVGGQYIDIQATDSELTLRDLQTMHALKTGALIQASLALGGIAANASSRQLHALENYGRHIGLAFQVVDDILDVESDTSTLGKTQGKDDLANKPTYVKLLGMEGAKREARSLLEQAIDSLGGLDSGSELLESIARFIVSRDR